MSRPPPVPMYTSFSPFRVCARCGVHMTEVQSSDCPKGKGHHVWTVELRENPQNRSGNWLLTMFTWDALRRIFRR